MVLGCVWDIFWMFWDMFTIVYSCSICRCLWTNSNDHNWPHYNFWGMDWNYQAEHQIGTLCRCFDHRPVMVTVASGRGYCRPPIKRTTWDAQDVVVLPWTEQVVILISPCCWGYATLPNLMKAKKKPMEVQLSQLFNLCFKSNALLHSFAIELPFGPYDRFNDPPHPNYRILIICFIVIILIIIIILRVFFFIVFFFIVFSSPSYPSSSFSSSSSSSSSSFSSSAFSLLPSWSFLMFIFIFIFISLWMRIPSSSDPAISYRNRHFGSLPWTPALPRPNPQPHPGCSAMQKWVSRTETSVLQPTQDTTLDT